jgi:hypothetical protein
MSEPIPSPPPPAAARLGESSVGRVAGVLWRPRDTFAAIAVRPTWVAPLVIIVLASLVSTALWVPMVDVTEMIRDRITSSGQDVPAAQVDRAVDFMSRLKWVMFLGPVLVLQPLLIAGVAVFFYLVFRVLGSEQTFRQSFAVTAHAFLPLAVAALLAVPILLGRDSISTEELMGGGVLASNLGVLAPEDASAPVRTALQSLDFFALWTVILLIIGFRQATRVPNPSVVISVLCAWALSILVRMGFASLASLAA